MLCEGRKAKAARPTRSYLRVQSATVEHKIAAGIIERSRNLGSESAAKVDEGRHFAAARFDTGEKGGRALQDAGDRGMRAEAVAAFIGLV